MCEYSKIPININSNLNNVNTNIVDLLQIDYQDSSCRIKNMCSYLLLGYDDTQKNQVMFNNKYYKLKNIKIYRPSLHNFDGKGVEGEMVLNHKGEKDSLKICIPILRTSEKIEENITLKNIFRHSYSKAQCEGDSVMIRDINLNANSFIPKTQGYYYYKTGDMKYDILENINNICGDKTTVVVYHKDDGYIGITNSSKDVLDKLINKHGYSIKEGIYKYNNTNGVFKEGFDIKTHEKYGDMLGKAIHRHDPDDIKGKKPLDNDLFKAVYKGDVDKLMNVLGGKRKVNRTMSQVRNYKWFEKHILNYMYYMSGVIIILMYYIIFSSSQTNDLSDSTAQLNALLQDTFGKAAAKNRPKTLADLEFRIDKIETKIGT